MKFFTKICFLLLSASSLPSVVNALEFIEPFPADVKQSVLKDLEKLRSFKGITAGILHQKFIGLTTSAETYLKYLDSRVSSLNFRDDFLGTYLMVADGSKTKIVSVTSDYLYYFNDISQMARISILIHEAEHNREAKSDHVYCPDVLLNEDGTPNMSPLSNSSPAGAVACDQDETGTYAIQTIFLRNIAKYCTNCTSEEKADAANVARLLLPRVLSEPAKIKIKSE